MAWDVDQGRQVNEFDGSLVGNGGAEVVLLRVGQVGAVEGAGVQVADFGVHIIIPIIRGG